MNPLLPERAQRNLVLASRSPRRIEILKALGFEFTVAPAPDEIEEGMCVGDPFELPVFLAELKAADVAGRYPDSLVIAADTVVILNRELLGKPRDDREAVEHLSKLSGEEHTVVTGVVVRRNSSGLQRTGREETRVRFRTLTADEIRAYVASGEGRDKAGSYAVQGLGAGLVRTIDGCFYNVVGLPVALLFELLKKV